MKIYFDFPLILTLLVFLSGIIFLIDRLFFAAKRKQKGKNDPWYVDYAVSFFPVLLIILLIRSFLIQPYRVPSGSLEPTILPGDFILVNQFAYGLRLPVINTKIWPIGEPKEGDIALFRYPVDLSTILVKRVIGVPGDHIVYQNKQLTINGKLAKQEGNGTSIDAEDNGAVDRIYEKLPNGMRHEIFVRSNFYSSDDFDIKVPPGVYFMMGDNRDKSNDSRYWGFVPEENLIGKAMVIWMSWDKEKNMVRFKRIGKSLY